MQICRWPERPALPPQGQPVLIRVAVSPARQAARSEVRVVLRAVLGAWSGQPPSQILLAETGRGPVWRNALAETNLDISLAYGASEAWVGLVRGGRIGVDVMCVEPFAEAQAVARNYLGAASAAAIAQARDPGRAFAAAWTKREAQLKCAKRGLTEWTGTDLPAAIETRLDGPAWIGAVVVTTAFSGRHA